MDSDRATGATAAFLRAARTLPARTLPIRSWAALLGCLLLLVAGTAPSNAQSWLKKLWSGGGGEKESTIDPSFFLEQGYCPVVNVRPGTESIVIRDKKGDTDPNGIYFQATVNDTARECHYSGDTLAIKVGVAGRVAAGPKGMAGTVTLPVRVVVIRAPDTVIYSNLVKVPVPIPGDLLAADFRQVVDFQIPVPSERDLRLHVGFDETGKSDPLGTPKKPAKPKATTDNSRRPAQ